MVDCVLCCTCAYTLLRKRRDTAGLLYAVLASLADYTDQATLALWRSSSLHFLSITFGLKQTRKSGRKKSDKEEKENSNRFSEFSEELKKSIEKGETPVDLPGRLLCGHPYWRQQLPGSGPRGLTQWRKQEGSPNFFSALQWP